MKKFAICVTVLATMLAFAMGAEEGTCQAKVVSACSSSTSFNDPATCSARYGGIHLLEEHIQAFTNLELSKSFEYYKMATHFNSYLKNRAGFNKLYKSLSDRSFENSIKLMKHLTMRGGVADLNQRGEYAKSVADAKINLELNELESLSFALDSEKKLANAAIRVHTHATHASERDPQVAHFIEEEFLMDQAKSVRALAGHVNDLSRILSDKNAASIGVHQFDQFLSKQ